MQEGFDNMGDHPCIFSEIGIPYDMDEKSAYKTGDYTSQVLAMDANHYGIEGSGMNGFTLWVYVAVNNHQWGDHWNGEDLSIYSADDAPLPVSPFRTPSKTPTASMASLPQRAAVDPSNLQQISTAGYRAAEAYVRPSPVCTSGCLESYGFDLRNCVFTMELDGRENPDQEAPTEVFLPEFHFPRDRTEVEVSSGKWTIETYETGSGFAPLQILLWWHGTGNQKLTVKGVKRKLGTAPGSQEEDEDYLDQCKQQNCSVM